MSTDAIPSTTTSLADQPKIPPLPSDPTVLQMMIRELLTTLHTREHELAGVRHRLDQLLRRLYGPRAERYDPQQPLFFVAEAPDVTEAPAGNDEVKEQEEEVVVKRRKHGGRARLPDHLPRGR